MFRFHRIGFVAALAALVIIANSQSAFGQRRGNNNFGGGSNNNNNNNNNNKDGNRGNRNRDNDDDKQSDVQKVQNLIQGGQGQGGQNNSGNQQYRRNNQQGNQGSQQTFKNQNQLQQFIGGGQGHQNNNWQKQKYNRHNDLQRWVVGFNGGPRPFSNDWYKHHPNAWHHHHHDHDNWEVATATGVLGFLGWQAARPYNNNPVYVYDPVPVQTVVVNGQPTVAVDPGNPGDWMTLGSFSLITGSGDPGTRILQLSIDKQGNIRGSYYDMITNGTNNVVGLVDRNTQQVRWTLDSNRQLTFVTTLDQLTQPQGVVNVKLPGGDQVQQWQLVRMENAVAGTQQ